MSDLARAVYSQNLHRSLTLMTQGLEEQAPYLNNTRVTWNPSVNTNVNIYEDLTTVKHHDTPVKVTNDIRSWQTAPSNWEIYWRKSIKNIYNM